MQKRKPPLHREVKKKVELPAIAAFDIETEGLGGAFIAGAIVTQEKGENNDNDLPRTNHSLRLFFNDLNELFEWMLDHPEYRYLAHNASGYEFSYLAPLVYDFFTNRPGVHVSTAIQGSARIVEYRIEWETGELTKSGKPKTTCLDIRDTLCLFNMSLEKVAKAYCPHMPKLKENINFETESFNPHNPEHVAYVFRDCDIVLSAYTTLHSHMVSVFGCDIGVTAGSTSIKAFKTTIPEGHVYYRINEEADEFVRKAYYGGLVIPGRQVGKRGETGSVDVNGAFAFQMVSHKFPVGSPTTTLEFNRTHTGFYHVRATVPMAVYDRLGFNPVPRRNSQGLDWPSGSFDTYLSSVEIEWCEKRGVTFEILSGMYWTREEPVFKAFIEKCQEYEIIENGKYKPTVKGMRNANYGKYATQVMHSVLVYSKEDITQSQQTLIPLTVNDTGEIIEGVYLGEEKSDSEFMMPHWAALITAYQRLYLMDFIEEAYKRGAKNVYTDTDSLKCDLEVLLSMVADKTIPIGTHYGEFKLEEICKEFTVLGGKCYMGELDNGEIIVKAKGIPTRELKKNARTIYEEAVQALRRKLPKGKRGQEAERGREIHFTGVKSAMSIIKERSHVQPVARKRKITDIRNSWAWHINKSGEIFPNGYIIRE